MTDNALRSETKGYNRGLILGFTMAESLLLVVFCLLLVAGAIIAKERKHTLDAQKKAAELEKTVDKDKDTIDGLNTKLVALMARQPETASAETQKEWRELVLARNVVDKLTKALAEQDPEKIPDAIQKMLDKEVELANKLKDKEEREKELAAAKQEIAHLEQKQKDDKAMVAAAQERSKPHDWPPIISLNEAAGYYFKSGSAELRPDFVDKLNGELSEEISVNLQTYGADIVEVIGHTDEQKVSRPTSNMDKTLIDVVTTRKGVGSLEPADNAGLGLARAVSVANVLRANQALSGITVLPLSAAQLIMPGDTLTVGQDGDVENRRRIEIRIRRREMPLE